MCGEREKNLRERIEGEFGNGEEFIRGNETAVVTIQLTEPLVQRNYLLLRDYVRVHTKKQLQNQNHFFFQRKKDTAKMVFSVFVLTCVFAVFLDLFDVVLSEHGGRVAHRHQQLLTLTQTNTTQHERSTNEGRKRIIGLGNVEFNVANCQLLS